MIVRLVDVRDGLTDADAAIDARLPAGVERITVFTRSTCRPASPSASRPTAVGIYLSAKAGQGVELLRAELCACRLAPPRRRRDPRPRTPPSSPCAKPTPASMPPSKPATPLS